jgi:hypothetical protein
LIAMADSTGNGMMARAMEASRGGRLGEAAELAKRAIALDGALAAGRHANLAQILAAGADLQSIARLAPLQINALITTGWLHSLVAGQPLNAHGQAIPWFTYPAIDFLEQRIERDWTVLEWGCGNSTLWWAARARRVISIEHNADWRQFVAALAPPNATVALVQDRAEYVNLQTVPEADRAGTYDVIVIDGEERNPCARQADRLAKPGGMIVFDNSDRLAVRDGLAFLAQRGWKRLDFFGLIPSYLYRTCTSILFRDPAILGIEKFPCEHTSSLGPTMSQTLRE